MKVGFPGGPRLEWYDRNPGEKSIQYIGYGVAPHSTAIRATYTVPTGKKAIVSRAYAEMTRLTAPTTGGTAIIFVGLAAVYVLHVTHFNATVGSREWGTAGGGGLFQAGDVITIQTIDTAEGGTRDFVAVMGITEIDA